MAALGIFLLFFLAYCSGIVHSTSGISSYKSSVELNWEAKLTGDAQTILDWTFIETDLGTESRVQNDKTMFQLVFLLVEDQWQLSIILWDDDFALLWTVDRPLQQNSTVNFEADGNLVLRNELQIVVWNSSTPSATQLWLSSDGFMSLMDQFNSSLWSSFTYPTNSMVCGQVLGRGSALVDGNYSFQISSNAATLYYKTQDAYDRWSFSPNSTAFGAFCCDSSGAYLQIRSDKDNVSQYGYLQRNWENCSGESVVSQILNLHLEAEDSYVGLARLKRGVLRIDKIWSRSVSTNACSVPYYCGTYGLCKNNTCAGCALDDSYTQLLVSGNYTAGCRLKSERRSGQCKMVTQNGYGYWRNTAATAVANNSNAAACERMCRRNSSCKAAFYEEQNGHCFLNSEIDTLRYANESDAFIKICYKKSYALTINVLAPVVAVAFVIVSLTVALIIRRIKRARGTKAQDVAEAKEEDLIIESSLCKSTLKRFSFEELHRISNGLKEQLGVGGFGTVYRGVLPNGEDVAIKILNDSSQEARDFCAELSILSRVKHLNLVQLLGFCATKPTRALVYEYMANGNLHQWLALKKSAVLNWKSRMEIAIGAAKSIAYLHEDCPDKILHLDLKPQNILLGKNFEPKVADFGLSKLMERKTPHVFMSTIRGTPGYLSPELCMGDPIDEKSDVYSFGVVLLNILAGGRLVDLELKNLWDYCKTGEFRKLVDKNLAGCFDEDEVRRMFMVALLCINHNPQLRPFMSAVVLMLEGKQIIPSSPTSTYDLSSKCFTTSTSYSASLLGR